MPVLPRLTRSVLAWRPRRAVLSVPGDSERKIQKASAAGSGAGPAPDCVCLDLEDAVAPPAKAVARLGVTAALAGLEFGRSERAVRVNAPDSEEFGADVAALAEAVAAGRLDALVVPKVDSLAAVEAIYATVAEAWGGVTHRGPRRRVALLTMCESGGGLLDLRSILSTAQAIEDGGRGDWADRLDPGVTFPGDPLQSPQSAHSPLQLQACIFGGDDFCASLALTRDAAPAALSSARATFALVTRSLGVQPIDQVTLDFRDPAAARAACEEGAALGMAGKHLIHPAQVAPAHAAFAPSPAAVADARRLVVAFWEHQREGQGAFDFGGRMIDNPTYLQAAQLVHYAEAIGME